MWPWERRSRTRVLYWGHWCGPEGGALALGSCTGDTGVALGTLVRHWCGPGVTVLAPRSCTGVTGEAVGGTDPTLVRHWEY